MSAVSPDEARKLRDKLTAIAQRDLDDRTITPGEARALLSALDTLEQREKAGEAEDLGSTAEPCSVVRMRALLAVADAARALTDDWARGGSQPPRRENCGDLNCGYASCALADALTALDALPQAAAPPPKALDCSRPSVEALEAERDRWHPQTVLGGNDVAPEKRGDCVRACMTSLLGLPFDAVENVQGTDWWGRWQEFAAEHGFALVVIHPRFGPPACLWIAVVPSLSLDSNHAVIARGYELVYDPGIERRYTQAEFAALWEDGKISEGWILAPLDPAASRAAEAGRDQAIKERDEAREALQHIGALEWREEVDVNGEYSTTRWRDTNAMKSEVDRILQGAFTP